MGLIKIQKKRAAPQTVSDSSWMLCHLCCSGIKTAGEGALLKKSEKKPHSYGFIKIDSNW